MDAEAHNNDEVHWFYADKKGDLTKAQIKAVNGQKYGFDVNGKMLHGLYKITFADDKKTIETDVYKRQEILSKALGNKTVLSGSISRGKNDPSQSLQMIGRPLMTPDELKALPKGHFILAKTCLLYTSFVFDNFYIDCNYYEDEQGDGGYGFELLIFYCPPRYKSS